MVSVLLRGGGLSGGISQTTSRNAISTQERKQIHKKNKTKMEMSRLLNCYWEAWVVLSQMKLKPENVCPPPLIHAALSLKVGGVVRDIDDDLPQIGKLNMIFGSGGSDLCIMTCTWREWI